MEARGRSSDAIRLLWKAAREQPRRKKAAFKQEDVNMRRRIITAFTALSLTLCISYEMGRVLLTPAVTYARSLIG